MLKKKNWNLQTPHIVFVLLILISATQQIFQNFLVHVFLKSYEWHTPYLVI